ncbi:MAG: D-alanyl-D-alanine carboxypeptidase [Actinomycetota bacterium]
MLLLVAIIPALGLLWLFRWSDDQIVDDADVIPPPSSTLVAPPPAPDPLFDPMLSYRRLPVPISLDLNVAQFVTDITPFIGTLNAQSCVAISVDGQLVGEQNLDLPVLPASNMKVVVAAVALETLGPEFRYTTRVTSSASPDAGGAVADLVLVGGGDPLLSSDWYPTSGLERRPVFGHTSLDTLADQVVAAGVSSVSGSVLGLGDRYDDEFVAPGWGPGVAGLDAGPYDALLVNDARVLGEDQRASDPNAGAAREFARLLIERGVSIGGGTSSALEMPAGADAVELASIQSVPLPQVLDEMLLNSDNNTAELMLKEIGLASSGDAEGTRQAGIDAVVAALGSWDVDTTGLRIDDGSGLSLDNRLTCRSLVDVLARYPADGPIGAALPVAGETGALSDVFIGHPVEGRLSGKTGTLNNPPFNADPPAVKALSGYVPVDGGSAVEYALVLNGPTISDQSEYLPVWDDLADVLATYPSGPTPAQLAPR